MAKFEKGEFVVVPNKSQALALRGGILNVYMALCSFADDEGGCFPSYQKLSEATQYTKRACMESTDILVDLGLITKEKRDRGNGSQSSNYYQIIIQSVGQDEGGVNHSSLPSEPQFTPITQPINSTTILSAKKESLLLLVNEITHRAFRALPERGVKKTLDTFSLEEIGAALRALAADPWHREKLKEFSLDYLIRSTTIDKFLGISKTSTTSTADNGPIEEELTMEEKNARLMKEKAEREKNGGLPGWD